MRRTLPRLLAIFPALFLVLLFVLWPLVGFTAASEDARLPPCCRRHGAHHCAMMLAAQARLKPAKTPQLEAPATCPSFPRTVGGSQLPTLALMPQAPATVGLLVQALPVAAHSSRSLSGILRARSGRGPPCPLQS